MRAADLLRAARAHGRLTQRELADRSGIRQSTIAAIETGRQEPLFRTLEHLVVAAGQQIDILPREGLGIDRTQFRATLRLSPAGRLRRAAAGARALAALREARRVSPD